MTQTPLDWQLVFHRMMPVRANHIRCRYWSLSPNVPTQILWKNPYRLAALIHGRLLNSTAAVQTYIAEQPTEFRIGSVGGVPALRGLRQGLSSVQAGGGCPLPIRTNTDVWVYANQGAANKPVVYVVEFLANPSPFSG